MIKRQIPNFITLGNLLCGVLSVYASLALDRPTLGALLICLGILLDFFDGFTARLLGVSSPLGKELDSLADVVTSGIAPAAILFRLTQDTLILCHQQWLGVFFLLIPLFAAYRLAKFNLDTRQSHSFLGLPVPSNALIWVGLALSAHHSILTGSLGGVVVIVVLTLLTDLLMVGEMPLFSLKVDFHRLGWRDNRVPYLFLIGCAVIIMVIRDWGALSVIIMWYILFSFITRRTVHA